MDRHETTPPVITQEILTFCHELIGRQATSMYVHLALSHGCVAGECFNNVAERVMEQGGKTILGRAIWQWANMLLTAEAHAVWERAEGQYIDITPQPQKIDRILFIPDEKMSFSGYRIPNAVKPLTESALVAELITASQKLRASDVSPDLLMRYAELHRQVTQEAGRNDPCPCQSGLKFKRCCGR